MAEVKFLSVEEINEMIKPGEQFTSWFYDEWKNIKNKIKTYNNI